MPAPMHTPLFPGLAPPVPSRCQMDDGQTRDFARCDLLRALDFGNDADVASWARAYALPALDAVEAVDRLRIRAEADADLAEAEADEWKDVDKGRALDALDELGGALDAMRDELDRDEPRVSELTDLRDEAVAQLKTARKELGDQ